MEHDGHLRSSKVCSRLTWFTTRIWRTIKWLGKYDLLWSDKVLWGQNHVGFSRITFLGTPIVADVMFYYFFYLSQMLYEYCWVIHTKYTIFSEVFWLAAMGTEAVYVVTGSVVLAESARFLTFGPVRSSCTRWNIGKRETISHLYRGTHTPCTHKSNAMAGTKTPCTLKQHMNNDGDFVIYELTFNSA